MELVEPGEEPALVARRLERNIGGPVHDGVPRLLGDQVGGRRPAGALLIVGQEEDPRGQVPAQPAEVVVGQVDGVLVTHAGRYSRQFE